MARIELRDCTVRFKDGFGGLAVVNDPDDVLLVDDTVMEIDGVTGLTNNTDLVPVGARFTVAGETGSPVHIVTAQDANETWMVTITDATGGTFTLTYDGQTTVGIDYDATPAEVKAALELISSITTVNVYGSVGSYLIELVTPDGTSPTLSMTIDDSSLTGGGSEEGTIALTSAIGTLTCQLTFTTVPLASDPGDGAVITFLPQQIEIKVGDGNITYTENKTYEYLLDRGDLDTVREGDQVPLDVNLECTFEHITTGTSEAIAPMDALKQIGGASEWVSSASDQCEPYAIDIEVEHTPPCGTSQVETVLFPDFRADTKEVNYQDAAISVSGKCNVTEPVVNRTD